MPRVQPSAIVLSNKGGKLLKKQNRIAHKKYGMIKKYRILSYNFFAKPLLFFTTYDIILAKISYS